LIFYQKGLQALPLKFGQSTPVSPIDLPDYLARLNQTGVASFSQMLELGLVYMMVIIFLWAGMTGQASYCCPLRQLS